MWKGRVLYNRTCFSLPKIVWCIEEKLYKFNIICDHLGNKSMNLPSYYNFIKKITHKFTSALTIVKQLKGDMKADVCPLLQWRNQSCLWIIMWVRFSPIIFIWTTNYLIHFALLKKYQIFIPSKKVKEYKLIMLI